MRKIILSIIIFYAFCSWAFSQINEKDNLLGPSLGLFTSPGVPTLGLNFESQVSQLGDVSTLGLGALMRLTNYKDPYPSSSYYDYNYFTLGFQTNLNFNRIGDGRFVPFVGAVVGYNNISSTRVNGNGTVRTAVYTSGLWLWGQGGMRYFFTPKVAGVIRIGTGNFNFNVLELGVDFKM